MEKNIMIEFDIFIDASSVNRTGSLGAIPLYNNEKQPLKWAHACRAAEKIEKYLELRWGDEMSLEETINDIEEKVSCLFFFFFFFPPSLNSIPR